MLCVLMNYTLQRYLSSSALLPAPLTAKSTMLIRLFLQDLITGKLSTQHESRFAIVHEHTNVSTTAEIPRISSFL